MHQHVRILAMAVFAATSAAVVPSAAHAQTPDGSLGECIELSEGKKEIFLDCVADLRSSIQEQFDLPDGWFEKLTKFVEEHPNWLERIRAVVDRLEDRWDRREDRRDGLEDRRDRFEDYRDRTEDLNDRWEDMWDEEFNLEGLFDRLEDRYDQRENRWDRREDRLDRREDFRDRFEDWQDDRWPPEI